jgi:formate-dependent nitrite reductase cytochrome c552 subunit
MPSPRFQKGNKICVGRKPWNKGRDFPQMKGNTFCVGRVPWNKGKKGLLKHSDATKKKMSDTQKRIGNKPPVHHWKGKDVPNWRGGVSSQNDLIRHSTEYKLWRTAVFTRDNFTCIWCGYKGNKLNADHIKSFAEYPELRFAIDNGRTLCINCHKKTDNYGCNLKYKKNVL